MSVYRPSEAESLDAPALEPPPAAFEPLSDVPAGAKVASVWIWQETSDCLWNMAKEHYGDPFLWPRIYEANRDVISDPHMIFPKQQIVIPTLDGDGTFPPAFEPEPVLDFDPVPQPPAKPVPPVKRKAAEPEPVPDFDPVPQRPAKPVPPAKRKAAEPEPVPDFEPSPRPAAKPAPQESGEKKERSREELIRILRGQPANK